jgi:LPS sulfotransferase NodH
MQYALLIARQRSGTGALGSVFEKHPQLKYLGEVFHPSNVGQEHNFFTFLRQATTENCDNALPDAQFAVFERFLTTLYEKYDGRRLIVDVKYRSLHHLDGGWRGLVQRPTILQAAIDAEVPILHLTRKNALQSFVSGRLAEANKVWHARDENQIEIRSTVINVRQLSNYIVSAEREIELIEEWLKGAKNTLQFDYNDLINAEGLLSPTLADALASVLHVDAFTDRAPTLVKQAPTDLRKAIENFEIVERALRGSTYQWMLK